MNLAPPTLSPGHSPKIIYATPRSTIDGDFVVDMNPEMLERFFKRLDVLFDREALMAFETVTGNTPHKFCHRAATFLVEVFEANLADPHECSRFDCRRSAEVEGRAASVTTAEDVIVQKLRWFKQIRRVKDREDVRIVVSEQWDSLDWPYLEHLAREHGTLELLNEWKQSVERLR